MSASQIASPLPVASSRGDLRLLTGQDILTGLSETLASSSHNRPSTPVRIIQEQEYSVPAPPPPSPVSFAPDHWPASVRR
ncbi:hypothetical protein SODALDRAFT_334819 [Sodiomyces alkalinus F11]|uniref:Uncharacterized protein n=1 Tax=Sodiomyces alkalinus (strain CBS 110278 / VKM F-3762 / F11) TaxID=1314773 RepID=A0A3N2PT41_SODAK|nr:hypothetical protein SODALDRAFT_334819 [Sodiomyces alkalinus F11]ROT37693.1 hypothetical protein SODALDRAFT_334819 [Sodiomyces alkalinus F11]